LNWATQMSVGIGDDFQRKTKHTREKVIGGYLDWSSKPDTYKNYLKNRTIKLSNSFPDQTLPLLELLKRRRSIRSFSGRPVKLADLAFLLWASTGIQRKEKGYEFRTAPSAGALYPIETYIVVNHVDALEHGLYHYSIRSHSLEELKISNLAEETAHAALGQEMCAQASVTFIWTAVFQRSKWKYADRAYRYVYLDAGHIAQNLALSAISIGMGTCQIAAFYDEEINEILGVDGEEESAIYLSIAGYPRKRAPEGNEYSYKDARTEEKNVEHDEIYEE
jgi:SagB-type dehydrogenase family enzyme